MHIILTGASGLVGSSVLSHLLSLPASTVSQITILARKPVAMAEGHARVRTIIHKDFTSYPPDLVADLKGAHGLVWALGVSQNEVGKEDYVKITKDYPLAAAVALKDMNGDKGINFVYVSGEGATLKPGMFTPIFGRVKGETEKELFAIGQDHPNFRAYLARPGGVDPAGHIDVLKQAGGRKSGMLKATEAVLLTMLKGGFKNMHSPTRELGQALAELAMGDGQALVGLGIEGEGRTITNIGLRRLAGI